MTAWANVVVRCVRCHRRLWAMGLLLGAGPVSADTWQQMLEAALQRSPEVQTLQAGEAVISASRIDAGRWLPQSPELSVTRRSDQWQSDEGVREWEVEMATPLWNNGQRQAHQRAVAAADSDRQAQQQLLHLTMAAELRDAVWLQVEREALLTVAQARVQTAAVLEQAVIRRVNAGELAQADGLLAQSETLAARNQQADAELQWLDAQQKLQLLTGSDSLPQPLYEIATNVERSAAALEQHPRVLAARDALGVAQARVAVARNDRAPVVGALMWSQTREALDDSDRQWLGMKITLPLGAEGRQRSAVATAQAELAGTSAQLEKTRREVDAQIGLAQANLTNAERQEKQADQQYQAAAQSLALSQRAFDAGELDLLSILRLRQSVNDAFTQRELKRVARGRASAMLNQAWGLLP